MSVLVMLSDDICFPCFRFQDKPKNSKKLSQEALKNIFLWAGERASKLPDIKFLVGNEEPLDTSISSVLEDFSEQIVVPLLPIGKQEELVIPFSIEQTVVAENLHSLVDLADEIKKRPAILHIEKKEFENLKSQFATSSSGWGGRRKLPYAFTEHGAIMAASVLNSKRAVAVSIYVVRAFLQLRQILIPYKELKPRLEQLEKRLRAHDEQIAALAAIQQLISAIEEKRKSQIGYLTEAKGHRKKVKKRKRKKRKTKGRKK